jgi:hypothetical protein
MIIVFIIWKQNITPYQGVFMKAVLIFLAGVCAIVLSSCGKMNTTGVNSHEEGSLCLNLRIVKPSATALAKTSATQWDSIIIIVSGPEMVSTRRAIKVDASRSSIIDTLNSIPAGTNRSVEVTTKNTAGITVHTAAIRTTDLAAGEVKNLSFLLSPQAGSIYVDLTDIPTAVDSIWASFISGTTVVGSAREKRESKKFMSIDYIPDGTSGRLLIAGYDIETKDTLYQSQVNLTFSVNQNITVTAPFSAEPSVIVADIAMQEPGVTLVNGQMLSGDSVGREYGPLMITEVMYAVEDSEYIELYNYTNSDTTFDTLVVDIDGTDRKFASISIPAKGFFVIGRKALPWANSFHPTSSALNLSSTTGNWITVKTKTGRIIDWIAIASGTNAQQWPKVTGSAAIVLDSLPADPAYNNYGMNWLPATSKVDPSLNQLGTPGKAGK